MKKQITIRNTVFNDAMKTIKNTLGTGNDRPILKMCKCEVGEQYIRFISLDGYCANIIKIEHKCEDVERFNFMFTPFSVAKDKQGIKDVIIEDLGEFISFKWVDEEDNSLEKKIKAERLGFVGIDEIYNGNRTNTSAQIRFDVHVLMKTLKAFTGGRFIKITFDKENPHIPIFISSENETSEMEALVLPCRC